MPQLFTKRCSESKFACKPAPIDLDGDDHVSTIPTCEICHSARHDLNLSPNDIVLELCDNSQCQMDRVVGHTSIGLTNANASKRENRKTHFTIRSTCEGTLLKTLLDTGATTWRTKTI